MAADEKALGDLHTKVAQVLTLALDGDVLPGYTDPETDEWVEEKRLPPSAAIIAAATKFLKDNNITCAPSKDNALGELEARLANRNKSKAGKSDLVGATEAMANRSNFLGGLQ